MRKPGDMGIADGAEEGVASSNMKADQVAGMPSSGGAAPLPWPTVDQLFNALPAGLDTPEAYRLLVAARAASDELQQAANLRLEDIQVVERVPELHLDALLPIDDITAFICGLDLRKKSLSAGWIDRNIKHVKDDRASDALREFTMRRGRLLHEPDLRDRDPMRTPVDVALSIAKRRGWIASEAEAMPAPAPAPARGQGRALVHLSKRSDVLVPLIEKAQALCADPFSPAEVWPHMERFAQAKTPPLVGVCAEGLRYEELADLHTLTRDNLGDRLRRAKKASQPR